MPRKVCCVEQGTGAGWYCPLSDLVRVRDEPAQRWDGDEELLPPPDNLRELDNLSDARHARPGSRPKTPGPARHCNARKQRAVAFEQHALIPSGTCLGRGQQGMLALIVAATQ